MLRAGVWSFLSAWLVTQFRFRIPVGSRVNSQAERMLRAPHVEPDVEIPSAGLPTPSHVLNQFCGCLSHVAVIAHVYRRLQIGLDASPTL